jgi:GntR family transcriptional regulator, transcriptional repressor for pyruvate dehydrogenase complex
MTTQFLLHAGFDDRPPPIPSQTDVVVDGIKSMIIRGQLGPGARLPREKDLALELNVSRGPLREGVRALCLMGVLETRQGDGTYVTSLDASLLLGPMAFLVDLGTEADVFHLQAVRRVLETEAAGRAAQLITDAAVGEASDILAQVEPLITSTSDDHFSAFIEADIAFHRVIAHASGNPALEALIEALAARTVRGRLWRAISEKGALSSTHREHQAILQAIARRDPDAARIRMGTHLLAVQEFLHDHPQVAGMEPGAILDHQPPLDSG